MEKKKRRANKRFKQPGYEKTDLIYDKMYGYESYLP